MSTTKNRKGIARFHHVDPVAQAAGEDGGAIPTLFCLEIIAEEFQTVNRKKKNFQGFLFLRGLLLAGGRRGRPVR